MPSHYVNHRWVIVNWTLRNKLQWKFNENIKLFIHENASENIVCEMAAILSGGGGGWVNPAALLGSYRFLSTVCDKIRPVWKSEKQVYDFLEKSFDMWAFIKGLVSCLSDPKRVKWWFWFPSIGQNLGHSCIATYCITPWWCRCIKRVWEECILICSFSKLRPKQNSKNSHSFSWMKIVVFD